MKRQTAFQDNPIGVFDSGVGGLTVVKEIEKALPKEKIIYFGDTARVPYGTKSKNTVTRFSIENTQFLLRHRVKCIVVACNTSSSLALHALEKRFRIPIVGVITPGALKAVKLSRSKRIGVIGTKATISSGVYETSIKKTNHGCRVYSESCPLFVPLAEEGWLTDEITRCVAKKYLTFFKNKKIDTLILGCTHYPLLKGIIKEVIGKDVTLVDSAREIACEVKRLLVEKGIISKRKKEPMHRFFVSDEPTSFIRVGERFLGKKIRFVKKVNHV